MGPTRPAPPAASPAFLMRVAQHPGVTFDPAHPPHLVLANVSAVPSEHRRDVAVCPSPTSAAPWSQPVVLPGSLRPLPSAGLPAAPTAASAGTLFMPLALLGKAPGLHTRALWLRFLHSPRPVAATRPPCSASGPWHRLCPPPVITGAAPPLAWRLDHRPLWVLASRTARGTQ